MNIFTLFLFRRMCQNLLISAPDAGTRHFWHTSLAKGIDIQKEIKTDKDINKKKLIIGIVGVLVVAGGIWFFTGKTSKGGIRLETAKVGRSSISNTVTATGTVEPVTEVEVGTQVSGIIDKLYADYNDVVKAGQLIAEMDKVNLKAELASAEAQLASSKSEFEYQQNNYARNKILFEKKLISDSDYETSTYNYEKAKAAYEQNQAAMVKVNRNLEYATITSPIDGVVIVTSPQSLVSMIVSKAVNMARMMNIPVYGFVENYSYFQCPDCGKKVEIFGKSKLDELALQFSLPVLARLPIEPNVAALFDAGSMAQADVSGLMPAAELMAKA